MHRVNQDQQERPNAVAVAMSASDESRRVSEAAHSLSKLSPDATLEELLEALETALHRVAGLGMVTAQGALTLSDDQTRRDSQALRIEARLMRIENQLRRRQHDRRQRMIISILLGLLAFSVCWNLF